MEYSMPSQVLKEHSNFQLLFVNKAGSFFVMIQKWNKGKQKSLACIFNVNILYFILFHLVVVKWNWLFHFYKDTNIMRISSVESI